MVMKTEKLFVNQSSLQFVLHRALTSLKNVNLSQHFILILMGICISLTTRETKLLNLLFITYFYHVAWDLYTFFTCKLLNLNP